MQLLNTLRDKYSLSVFDFVVRKEFKSQCLWMRRHYIQRFQNRCWNKVSNASLSFMNSTVTQGMRYRTPVSRLCLDCYHYTECAVWPCVTQHGNISTEVSISIDVSWSWIFKCPRTKTTLVILKRRVAYKTWKTQVAALHVKCVNSDLI